MELTGDDIKRLVGECECLICCPEFWQELADKINEEVKKSPELGERPGINWK